jgi:para-aminobenzoate synthetase / 4-amino-4-deoxychorismate lyase
MAASPPRRPLAVLQDAAPDRWLVFAAPPGGAAGPVVARTLGEVRPALAAAARRVESEGLWAVGFVAYEAAPAFDRALVVRPPAAPDGDPDAAPPLLWLTLLPPPAVVEAPVTGAPGPPLAAGRYRCGPWQPSVDAAAYRRAVDEVRRRIARGDTYQVNYTYRLRAAFEGDPAGLFRDLAAAQGGAHGGWIDAGRHAVCCASPELFFAQADGAVTARPMKGTAPRGRWSAEDGARARRLAASPKERAENLMIVDMMRNDLGRVAEAGTVEVPRLFAVERYPTLWQMTSTVTARTRAAPAEVLAALFPCASITGAPKAATSAVIAELEGEPRGVYTGALGWLAPGGRGRFSVAIRTAVVDRERGEAVYGVGGGIVWDSRAGGEAAESRLKARVLTAPRRDEPFALLETLRWTPADGCVRLDAHLARLAASAAYFGYRFDEHEVRAGLSAAVPPRTAAVRVRLSLSRDGRLAVETEPLPSEALGAPTREGARDLPPVPVGWAAEPVDPEDAFLFHKTTRRGVYEAALAVARRRRPEAREALLWNRGGEATEAATANLVAELGGRLLTPPLASGLLPGILRAELLTAGEVEEATLAITDVAAARRLWLVSSLRGWRPARLLDPRPRAASRRRPAAGM